MVFRPTLVVRLVEGKGNFPNHVLILVTWSVMLDPVLHAIAWARSKSVFVENKAHRANVPRRIMTLGGVAVKFVEI